MGGIIHICRTIINPRTDAGPGHLSTDGGGADNRPPGDLENEAS